MRTPHGLEQTIALFGNLSNPYGALNPEWERNKIKSVLPPAGWQLYYQDDKKGNMAVSGIRMHKLIEGEFVAVLKEIWQYAKKELGAAAGDEDTRKWLHELGRSALRRI